MAIDKRDVLAQNAKKIVDEIEHCSKRMTAAQTLANLPRPMFTPEEAAAWLEDSKGNFDQSVNDPWR